MNIKNLYISAGVLTILAIATSLFKKSDSAPLLDDRVGTAIVERTALSDTAKIIVEKEDETLTFANMGESNTWVLEERYNLPVTYDRISQLAQNVHEAKLQRFVSENPERIATLGFETGERIRFSDKLGTDIVAFQLGKETENGRQFMRYEGEEKAFLVDTTFFINASLDSWLEKKLVDFGADDVTAIEASLQNGDQIRVTRENADSDWETDDTLPEGKILNQSSVGQIASRLSDLTFTATAETGDENVVAAKENSHQFTLKLNNGDSYEYAIGRQPEVAVEREVEKEGENGEATTEIEEEVVTPEGPVYYFIASSNNADPVNSYMERAAFEASSYQFTSLPDTLEKLLSDAPEPEESPTPLVTAPEEEPAP
ncbi:MAG TPA: hypothetical protein DIV79_10700 [Opitutae bacterium]|nr:hypothetical protein [Opitutaceae bacterium]HCR30475.1 hypothetical protein [Opitutae bacterium]